MSVATDFLGLPNIKKNFISFTFDGKKIEEFGLIATFSGDRFNTQMTRPFRPYTTEVPGRMGQLFWGATLQPIELAFSLATDEMTAQQLEKFKAHFRPNKVALLTLSESPYRSTYARISNIAAGSFIPFREDLIYQQGTASIPVITTIYKGSVSLNFTIDFPIWRHSLDYVILTENPETMDPELLKAVFEDSLPTNKSLQTAATVSGIFLSNNYFYNTGTGVFSNPAAGTQLRSSSYYSILNAGTAEAPCQISLTLTPTIDPTTHYIVAPYNSHTQDTYKQTTISIKDATNQVDFSFTLPSIWASINRAISIVNNYPAGSNILDLSDDLRDNIGHFATRAWAMAQVIAIQNNPIYAPGGAINASGLEQLKLMIPQVITNESGIAYPGYFTFNSENGTATITTKYTKMVNVPVYDNDIVENASDMMRTGFLFIPANYGNMPANYRITTNASTINNFKIIFAHSYA